jgi:hypothetical protein
MIEIRFLSQKLESLGDTAQGLRIHWKGSRKLKNLNQSSTLLWEQREVNRPPIKHRN